MYKIKLSVATLFTLIILLFLHKQGIYYSFYSKYWFYDIILHFIGGVGIALSIWCISEFFNIKFIKDNYARIIFFTFIAGIAWELFEIYYNIAGYRLWTIPYYLDTAKDLTNDILGSLSIYLFIKYKK